MSQSNEGSPAAPGQRQFFGHPAGLGTLFFTELWERFSYYGMRALLVLFMTAAVVEGGMGFDDPTANAIYGLYTAGVYLAALPGGWLADRIFGQQNAIWYGGIIIAAGHIVLSLPGFEVVPESYGFFLGLILIVVGTGLLKPNISSCVGELYPEGGARRDAGYVIYYMGINVGAAAGPFICGLLRVNMGWHWGFAAAAVGMIAGLIVYRATQRHLGEFGKEPHPTPPEKQGQTKAMAWGIYGGTAALFGVAFLALGGVVVMDARSMAELSVYVIVGVAVLFFARVLLDKNLTKIERNRTVVLVALFIGAALFWSGFEQAGSSLNLFAERFTDRELVGGMSVQAMLIMLLPLVGLGAMAVAAAFDDQKTDQARHTAVRRLSKVIAAVAFTFFGIAMIWSMFDAWVVPTEAFQSLNPVYILIFAPFFSALWINLGRRNADPSIPMKFAIGFAQLGIGFGFMWIAASLIQDGDQVLPTWLLLTYLFHTTAELCVSPIGLSATSKLAPRSYYSQMMGMWFFGAALGNLLAGLLAGEFSGDQVDQFPDLYRQIVIFCGVVTVGFLVATPFLKKMAALDEVSADDMVREDEPGAYEGGGPKQPRD
ncbi:MAG: MFS transporter [Gammaproteobacteria bacterium]|jgi:POT family proton-dependent oligopeptide transporter|nr:MFS transporter [Gammaproteobacteria bacterium]